MPAYTFACHKCKKKFEIVCSISKYSEVQNCPYCNSPDRVDRCYIDDVASLSASVKKSDSELKTIGDIANRNRDRLSDDEKNALYQKHNSYKEEPAKPELPKGFTRMKKQPKTKWN
jgi:putative FmdB family regulatory protein